MSSQSSLRNFIDGEWTHFEASEATPVFNPSLGETIAESPVGNASLVNAAVAAAKDANAAWADTPPIARARIFFRYRQLLEANFEEISQIVSKEHGKTLAESKAELQRGMECVEYACAAPELLKGESLENIARGIDCEVLRRPLGVCVGITPFNFPVMIAMWMYPLALVSGNTFILKPSEKVPHSAIRIVELLHEAGLPKGVLNLIQGGKTVVEALLRHPDVQAVSFVGSSPVAKYIYEEGTRHGKRVQANGGAKNHAIVMPDAEVDKTVSGIIGGAFGCAGERCMAISSAIVIGDANLRVLPSLTRAADSIKVNRTDIESDAAMGPLITSEHRDRVASIIGNAVDEGGKALSDGRDLKIDGAPKGFFLGPTIIDDVTPDMAIGKTEVFGPVLGVMRAGTLAEAIQLANATAFGNGAAIFTQSGSAAREFSRHVEAGMIGINVGVPAPMAMFPFSGWNESFYGDLHIQGRDGIRFYTREKTVTSRWFGNEDVWRK